MVRRVHLKKSIKEKLIIEAGNKCANPGCPSQRIEFHHIKEWSAYQLHDESHMIAICPTCHAEVHHGRLKIDDEKLYNWKRLERIQLSVSGHLYSDPSQNITLICGSIGFKTNQKKTRVFRLSKNNEFGYEIINGEYIAINLSMADSAGNNILQIEKGYIKHKADKEINYFNPPGRFVLIAPFGNRFMTERTLNQIRRLQDDYCNDNMLTLLDVEVTEPGIIRVKGLWIENEMGCVIFDSELMFVQPMLDNALAIRCSDEGKIAVFESTIDVDDGCIFGYDNAQIIIPVRGVPLHLYPQQ